MFGSPSRLTRNSSFFSRFKLLWLFIECGSHEIYSKLRLTVIVWEEKASSFVIPFEIEYSKISLGDGHFRLSSNTFSGWGVLTKSTMKSENKHQTVKFIEMFKWSLAHSRLYTELFSHFFPSNFLALQMAPLNLNKSFKNMFLLH